MATNYYFADTELKIEGFEIKSKSSLPGRRMHRSARKPTIQIKYYGLNKELVFKNSETEKVERAEKVILTIRKGLYGYEILENYDTVDKGKQ
ncbi:hypothetical protein SanaruYs_18240 [Chryseotalea sanaruensis]|uniref:Uncharacterized protein n=2 Tax=Chryseotalea sanaruensis TaxID=2482724 RepID=A0A401U9K7_9BACT|nr:hypothetical protein SanaruYs_18240 [Chryseotalea sanaruensis]